MKNRTILLSLLSLLTIGLISSCGPDPKPPITGEALFTYVPDGYTVTFTNTSTVTGTVTYLWEFGDGETSTEKDPVHTYAGKGEYNVKLTVTDEEGKDHVVSTKITVDKKTRIHLDDNSVSDWDAVTENDFKVTLGDNSGIIKSLTFDYDAKYLYAKLVFEGSIQDSIIFNAFLDTDNDVSTGFISHLWPLLGGDYLLQGQIGVGSASWLGTFEYSGTDGGWGWTEQQLQPDYYVMGAVLEDGGQVTWEIGFDRAKIPGLSGDAVKLAFYLSDKSWAEVGYAPDKTEEGGDPQDGFVVKMN